MGKIDTSGWKEFKLGYIMVGNKKQGHGLFEIVNSVAYHGKDVTETDSDDGINYITRSKFNNGLKARVVRLDKFKVNPAGTISFGAENADFFYQTEPYITGNKMYYIDTTALSERACRFLKSILEATFTANYSFSDGMIPARIYDECIKLPTTPNGAPDWAYMESYMANLETRVAESLSLLQAAKDAEKKKVDTREWGSFALGTLFNIVKGKRLTKAEMKSGKIPFIGSSALNNGCTAMIGNDKNQHPVNTITVCYNGSVGETFYQDQPYIALDDVNVLYPKFTMNRQIALFIVPLIKGVSSRYDYIDKWKKEAMEADKIYLPIDKNGDPDWDYMEEYMKMVQGKTENVLNQFVSM